MRTIQLQPEAVVFDGREQHDLAITVRGDRIISVDRVGARPDVDEVRRIDGTLLPGPVDLQVNGAGGRGCEEMDTGAFDTIARSVRAGGASAFLPTVITASIDGLCERIRALVDWIERGPAADGAVPLGLHVEGPFLEIPGAHDPSQLVDPTPERVDAILDAAGGYLRLVTLAPGRPGAPAAVERFRAAGATVSLGHAASTTSFEACVAAGASMVTHLFNVMSPLHHREPGIVGHALDEPRVSCGMIVDGVHIDPLVVRVALRCLGVERTILVTDAVGAAGMPDGDYELSGMPVHSEGGIVRDRTGRLAGSALTMSMAATNLAAYTPSISATEVARVTAANPARLIGTDEWGEIKPGAHAAFAVWRNRQLEGVVL